MSTRGRLQNPNARRTSRLSYAVAARKPPEPRKRAQALAQPHELLVSSGQPAQLFATLTDRPLNRPATSQEHAAGRQEPVDHRLVDRVAGSGGRPDRAGPNALEDRASWSPRRLDRQAIAGGELGPGPRGGILRRLELAAEGELADW